MTEEAEKKREVIHSKIWEEVPEPDNPFAAAACYCSGFDVYGDLLGKISWIEYLYLLFKLEPPTKDQAKLLEGIAVAIANPGPRDLSVRAAMNGGVGGSLSASCLIAALGPGAGQYGGGRELYLSVRMWNKCGESLGRWEAELIDYMKDDPVKVWPEIDHIPGFDPYGFSTPQPTKQVLDYLASLPGAKKLGWLNSYRETLEKWADGPITQIMVVAAAFVDLGFTDEQSEMLFLLLRLPGAAAHALEQRENGLRKYPFFGTGLVLKNDPGPKQVS